MEPTNSQTGLAGRIAEWQDNLSAAGALTSEDVAELTLHLEDSIQVNMAKGLCEDDAWILAAHHIGAPVLLNQEFGKVNPDFMASRNWMMILWGAMGFFLLQTLVMEAPVLSWLVEAMLTNGKRYGHEQQHVIRYYIISGAIILASVAIAFNAVKISIWFNKLLIKRSSVLVLSATLLGLIAAFVNFVIYNEFYSRFYITLPGYGSNSFRHALSTIIVVFYVSLIVLTAFTTFRYRSQELRSFRAFSKTITWKHAFMFGFIAQVPVQFCRSFQILYMPPIVAIALFGLTGWVLGYSKNGWLNIAFAQLVPMFLLIFGWYVNHIPEARIDFSIEYFCTIGSLVMAYIITHYTAKNSLILNN